MISLYRMKQGYHGTQPNIGITGVRKLFPICPGKKREWSNASPALCSQQRELLQNSSQQIAELSFSNLPKKRSKNEWWSWTKHAIMQGKQDIL